MTEESQGNGGDQTSNKITEERKDTNTDTRSTQNQILDKTRGETPPQRITAEEGRERIDGCERKSVSYIKTNKTHQNDSCFLNGNIHLLIYLRQGLTM